MYCTKCGHKNPEGNKFCVKCGNELKLPVSSPSQHSPSPSGYKVYSQNNINPAPDENPLVKNENFGKHSGIKPDYQNYSNKPTEQETHPAIFDNNRGTGTNSAQKEIISEKEESTNGVSTPFENQNEEEGNATLPVYDEPKKSKTKLLFGLLAVVLIIGFGIWGYSAYVSSAMEETVLENGMTIIKYKINKTIDFTKEKSIGYKCVFDYDIDWPVDGPQPLLDNSRKWILQQLEANEGMIEKAIASNSLQNILDERIKNNSPTFKDGYYDGAVEDKIEIRIKADDKKTSLTSNFELLWRGSIRTQFSNGNIIILNNGEKISYSMFPPIEKIRPYLLKHLTNWGEPIDWENQDNSNYLNLNYPSSLPEINQETLHFKWPISSLESLESTVPFSEISHLLSPQLKEIFSITDFNDSKASSENITLIQEPTKELLLAYGTLGVTNPSNEYLSKEFKELIEIARLLPNENPSGRGFFSEILWFWEGGEDFDGSNLYDAEIISVSDNKAIGTIKYAYKNYEDGSLDLERVISHKVTLVKEIVKGPSGEITTRWVVDDFEDEYNGGKKNLLIKAINDAGKDFSNGLGQRLMNDPAESGFMSESEKRDYLNGVDEFLKAYKEYKTKK